MNQLILKSRENWLLVLISQILNLLNLVVYSQYTAVHTSMFMVDESEPTDYNICQHSWRNVLRNAPEHRRDLYCIFVKLVKQNNVILSQDLAKSICQHVVGQSSRLIQPQLIWLYSVYSWRINPQWAATGDHFLSTISWDSLICTATKVATRIKQIYIKHFENQKFQIECVSSGRSSFLITICFYYI